MLLHSKIALLLLHWHRLILDAETQERKKSICECVSCQSSRSTRLLLSINQKNVTLPQNLCIVPGDPVSSAWCAVQVVTTGRRLLLDRKHLSIYEYLDPDHKVPWTMRGLPLPMTLWVMSYEFLPEKLFEMSKHLSCSWLALSFALSRHLQEVHLIFQPCIMTWLLCIGGAQEGKRRGGKKS